MVVWSEKSNAYLLLITLKITYVTRAFFLKIPCTSNVLVSGQHESPDTLHDSLHFWRVGAQKIKISRWCFLHTFFATSSAWHRVVVRISSFSITCIYGNHVCNMFHHWGILMATTQMFHYLHFHPFMPCCHCYSHNGQQRDADDEVPCPTVEKSIENNHLCIIKWIFVATIPPLLIGQRGYVQISEISR